jgi:hypothetical protein
MSEATANSGTFPFMQSVASVAVEEAKTGIAAMRRVVREYEKATETYGPLVPLQTVAETLGVAVQTVDDYITRGRLQAVELSGRRWVVGASAIQLVAEGPRKGGRPRLLDRVRNSARVGKELAIAAEQG